MGGEPVFISAWLGYESDLVFRRYQCDVEGTSYDDESEAGHVFPTTVVDSVWLVSHLSEYVLYA
jgi:hypothetical protein